LNQSAYDAQTQLFRFFHIEIT